MFMLHHARRHRSSCDAARVCVTAAAEPSERTLSCAARPRGSALQRPFALLGGVFLLGLTVHRVKYSFVSYGVGKAKFQRRSESVAAAHHSICCVYSARLLHLNAATTSTMTAAITRTTVTGSTLYTRASAAGSAARKRAAARAHMFCAPLVVFGSDGVGVAAAVAVLTRGGHCELSEMNAMAAAEKGTLDLGQGTAGCTSTAACVSCAGGDAGREEEGACGTSVGVGQEGEVCGKVGVTERINKILKRTHEPTGGHVTSNKHAICTPGRALGHNLKKCCRMSSCRQRLERLQKAQKGSCRDASCCCSS